MIIYLILLCQFIISSNALNNNYIISNDLFSAKFNSNQIILGNDIISYGYLTEYNKYNTDVPIDFNYIYQDTEYSMNYVKTSLSSKQVNIEVINKMFTNTTYEPNDYNKITKFVKDKLYVTIIITTWKNRSEDYDLVLDLNINNLRYNNDIQFGNYIIDFPKTCNADTYKEKVFIDKEDNKILIRFPYHTNQIVYTYSIYKKLPYDFSILYYSFGIVFTMVLSFIYYKYKTYKKNQYYYYEGYYNKYKYY